MILEKFKNWFKNLNKFDTYDVTYFKNAKLSDFSVVEFDWNKHIVYAIKYKSKFVSELMLQDGVEYTYKFTNELDLPNTLHRDTINECKNCILNRLIKTANNTYITKIKEITF